MCHPRAAVMVAVAHEYLSRRTPLTRLPRAGGVGYRREAARVAGGGPRGLPRQRRARLPRSRHAGGRQDHLRPADRHRAARPRHRSGRSPSSPPPSTSSTSGRMPPAGSASSSTRRSRTPARCSRTSTTASRSPTPRSPRSRSCTGAAPRTPPTLVDPRRDPPRRRRAVVGRRHPRGLRRRDPAARRSPGRRSAPTTNPIPFVRYEMGEDGILRSASDYTYGYADALRDGVVRPVLFLAYGGAMRWRTKRRRRAGRPARRAPDQGPDRAGVAHRARPDGRVDARRCSPPPTSGSARCAAHVPDAGGLVIASDQTAARAYADLLRTITGEDAHRGALRRPGRQRPHQRVRGGHLALDGRRAHGVRGRRRAAAGRRRVRDVASTPLFFAQAVGRFVRSRRRGETAASSCPRCRSSSATPRRWRRSATTR